MHTTLSWHPGYYGLALSPRAAATLTAVADVMIPGGGGYPCASAVGVSDFIVERLDSEQQALLDRLLCEFTSTCRAGAIAEWLHQLEAADPASFALLRFLVYTAYYRSEAVIRVINAHGFDYHGAPQPYGYRVAGDIPLPTHKRGSYMRTEEIDDVSKAR